MRDWHRAAPAPMLAMWPFRRNAASMCARRRPTGCCAMALATPRRPLDASMDCDVAIIGAGITGALIADALIATGRLRGAPGCAYESRIGSTAATTALLQYEIDTHLTDLVQHDRRGARNPGLPRVRCRVSTMLEQRFPELLAQCDYQRRESLYLAADERAVPDAARRARGAPRHRHHVRVARAAKSCGVATAAVARAPSCRRWAPSIDPVRFTRGLIVRPALVTGSGCSRARGDRHR